MRERILLDQNWRFALGHAADAPRDFDFARSRYLIKSGEGKGAAKPDFDDSAWRQVDLPHDWAIELPYDPAGDKDLLDHGYHAIGPDHPATSVGWYRKSFDLSASDDGRRISIEFDGVFRDSSVFVNGHYMGRHASGYTPFRLDLTDVANYGGANVIVVRVDASLFEGWWYEGAGIYRHVWLVKTEPQHVAPSGIFVTTKLGKSGALVTVRTTIVNDSDLPIPLKLSSAIRSMGIPPMSGRKHGRDAHATGRKAVRVRPWSTLDITQKFTIKKPKIWSPGEPNLYALRTTLANHYRVLDTYDTTFGIRTLKWDANRGLFLNGKPLKMKGFANHEDHAGVGVAVPDALHEIRLRKLKESGCNAYRAAHNCATPAVLDACDRLGLLVMAETRQAGSTPEALDHLQRMIVRDRNHPSIILWSIGNEEHTIQWKPVGERIGRSMKRLIKRLDPTRMVTAAMHDRSSADGFMNVVDVHGWNYIAVGDIEGFRKSNPRTPIVGSEESSVMTTRGVYTEDADRGHCAAYDLRTPKWGTTAERWWRFASERPWFAGGFAWTGFDHRGEPIAFKWPNVVSHFGVLDLAGFRKDNFYYYQSWWSDPRERTVLHLFPHWNWSDGQEIDVRCFTNCDEVELLLNARSLGRQSVVPNSHVAWKVPFEPGAIEAIGYQKGKRVALSRRETTGAPASLHVTHDHVGDIVNVTVAAHDDVGREVPTADNLVDFAVTGPAKILGVGNGDPSSHEPDRATQRKLFNGLAACIVQLSGDKGEVIVTATSPSLHPGRLRLRV